MTLDIELYLLLVIPLSFLSLFPFNNLFNKISIKIRLCTTELCFSFDFIFSNNSFKIQYISFIFIKLVASKIYLYALIAFDIFKLFVSKAFLTSYVYNMYLKNISKPK